MTDFPLSNATLFSEAPLSAKYDYDGSGNLIYKGEARAGTATSTAKWRIRKYTYSGSNLTAVAFADGNDAFDNVWDDRTTAYSYS